VQFRIEDEKQSRYERRRNAASIEALSRETDESGAESNWKPHDPTANVEEQFLACESKEELLMALSKLSAKQQQLVRLYYYEEKTEAEIAQELGINQSNVSRQLETIHKQLKGFLKN